MYLKCPKYLHLISIEDLIHLASKNFSVGVKGSLLTITANSNFVPDFIFLNFHTDFHQAKGFRGGGHLVSLGDTEQSQFSVVGDTYIET